MRSLNLIILFAVVVLGAWLVNNAEENLRGHQELQFRVETERIVNEVDSVADFSIPGGNDSRAGFAP